MRLSDNDWEHDKVVRASFPNLQSQIEEKFAALETLMRTVANRLDNLGGGETGRGYLAADEEYEQADCSNDADASSGDSRAAASMDDLKTVLVGVAGGPRSNSSGR